MIFPCLLVVCSECGFAPDSTGDLILHFCLPLAAAAFSASQQPVSSVHIFTYNAALARHLLITNITHVPMHLHCTVHPGTPHFTLAIAHQMMSDLLFLGLYTCFVFLCLTTDTALQASPHPTYADFGAAGHGHGQSSALI